VGMAGARVYDIPIELKATLVDDEGVSYRDFRATLKPRWWTIWAQLGAGYAVLAGVVVGLWLWAPAGAVAVAAALAGALVIGYTIAFINNFFHESAHYNLLPGRRANDLVTNLLMAWLYGSSIDRYRRIHWQHHRALGTTMDSENSYFDPLRIRYLVEGLLGMKTVRTLRRYIEVEQQLAGPAPDAQRLGWLLLAAAVNGGIMIGLALAGAWAGAGAWALGELVFFPSFVSLRQTLEHRDEDADPRTDYTQVDMGATNRLFGDGPVANTFGSAGFNRHALHHWEPQVSCSRLRELERYLARTELEPQLAERRTTYRDTFLRLLEP
jgi:fatty acid desaturase